MSKVTLMVRPALFILSILPATACISAKDGGINLERDSSVGDTKDNERPEQDADSTIDTPRVDASVPADAASNGADAAVPPAQSDASTNGVIGEDNSDDDTSTGEATESLESGQQPTSETDDGGASSEHHANDQTSDMVSEWADARTCVYHTEPVPFAEATAGDAGSDAGPPAGPPAGPHVTLLDSQYLGGYLADHAGYTLYIYTADLPGNCATPPVSTCFDDCLIAWPIFEAGDRVLGDGLDDAAFGTFIREDGLAQTTYFGWPLYYYKKDLAPKDVVGQGKGTVWYVAEQILPNLVIMRASEEREGVKYLANGEGFTLYTYSGDTLGTETHMPSSACVGSCLNSYQPFSVRSLRAVSELEPDELSVFVRQDGTGQQVSYRGQPLYLHTGDVKSGDMNGLLLDGFELVLP